MRENIVFFFFVFSIHAGIWTVLVDVYGPFSNLIRGEYFHLPVEWISMLDHREQSDIYSPSSNNISSEMCFYFSFNGVPANCGIQ